MRRTLLCIFFLLETIMLFSQENGKIGIQTEISQSINWGYNYPVVTGVQTLFPAERAGIKPLDIIMQVDGQSTAGKPGEEVTGMIRGKAGSEVVFTIHRLGQADPFVVRMIRQPSFPEERSMSEASLASYIYSHLRISNASVSTVFQELLGKQSVNFSKGIATIANIANHTLRDPEAKFEQYNIFDFEYTSTENPIMEKQLASVLQGQLEQKGMKRDQENPDLLVFISFYNGNEKQYIPPTSKVTTRYQYQWDIWSGWGNKPYVESQQQGGYTQVTYMCSFKVVMMDAKKAKTNPRTPPIVWQSEYSETSDKEIDLMTVAKARVFPTMIMAYYPVFDISFLYPHDDGLLVYNIEANATEFPVNMYYKGEDGKPIMYLIPTVTYNYTGLLFTSNNPDKVVYIYPDSPAEKAGMQVGDRITSVNGRIIPATEKEIDEDCLASLEKKGEKLRLSTLDKPEYKAGFTYLLGLYEQIPSTYTFEVDRNGGKMTFDLVPEKRQVSYIGGNPPTIPVPR